MKKYIITGKTSQETAASMLNKPQNRKEVTEPLAEAFGAKYVEFLYLNHPDFDFMCVVMAKNDEDMTAVSNLIYASGAFSSFNWYRAFEADAWKNIFQMASENMAHTYRPPSIAIPSPVGKPNVNGTNNAVPIVAVKPGKVPTTRPNSTPIVIYIK